MPSILPAGSPVIENDRGVLLRRSMIPLAVKDGEGPTFRVMELPQLHEGLLGVGISAVLTGLDDPSPLGPTPSSISLWHVDLYGSVVFQQPRKYGGLIPYTRAQRKISGE